MTPAAVEPFDYRTSVEAGGSGSFLVVVTTVHADGSDRMVVGTHPTRRKAELAASLVDRSAKRYAGVGTSDPDAPTFARPDHT